MYFGRRYPSSLEARPTQKRFACFERFAESSVTVMSLRVAATARFSMCLFCSVFPEVMQRLFYRLTVVQHEGRWLHIGRQGQHVSHAGTLHGVPDEAGNNEHE